MKGLHKKTIIIIVVAILIVIAIVALLANKQTRSTNKDYKLDPKIEKELKDGLGHGTAGDVQKVEEGVDDSGNRTYTFTFKNGNTQTVTVRKAKEGEAASGIDDSQIIDDSSETGGDSDNTQQKDDNELGTVFEKYNNLSAHDQVAFYLTFKNAAEFTKWYEAAEAEYRKLHPGIELGEGEILDFNN